MGTTKKDKLFTWLKLLHKIEDLGKTNLSDSKTLKELNKLFYIKERK
jgi:hypothetical protein